MIALKRPTFWQAINFFAVYITLGVQYVALALIMVFEAFGRKRKEVEIKEGCPQNKEPCKAC